MNPDRIGLTIDESEQLHPEQSTTAIITLHDINEKSLNNTKEIANKFKQKLLDLFLSKFG